MPAVEPFLEVWASPQWGYLPLVPTQGKTQTPKSFACRMVADGCQIKWPTPEGREIRQLIRVSRICQFSACDVFALHDFFEKKKECG